MNEQTFMQMEEQLRHEKNLRKKLEKKLVQAERASQAKSNFLSNVSHDIRTPMNAIIGFTTLASTHIEDKQRVLDYHKKIMSSSNHLLSLINDVLDISKIESGKMELDEKDCSLENILNELWDILQPQIVSKNLNFQIDMVNVTDGDWCCDKLRISQILLNLFSNAIKFTQYGGMISLSIQELKKHRKGYATYEFRVKDTGIGMSEEFQQHIFEAFERERSVNMIQGTGLGMAITKNIVDMMGGTIQVKSEQGKGTEFIVNLNIRLQETERKDWRCNPVKLPEGLCTKKTDARNQQVDMETFAIDKMEKDEEKNEKIETDRTFTDLLDISLELSETDSFLGNFDGKRVLLVEDNELNREIGKELLSDAGFCVEEAEDGSVAVEKIKCSEKGYYDLILMDVQMPIMDGYEATKVIRELPEKEHSEIPIIAMTASAFKTDKYRAIESGMDVYISKPIDVDELLGTLNTILNKHR